MNRTFKKLLKAARVYDLLSCWYHMLRQWKPGYFAAQLKYRFKGAPDGYPVPPARLIDRTIARGWAIEYFKLGLEEVDEFVECLRNEDLSIKTFKSILDFGCGCGRLIRHFRSLTDAELHGCDYDEKLIKWCSRKLPFAEFYRNDFLPPTQYADGSFDFIYLRSVFTHLGEETQMLWMAEFKRLLTTNGVVLFTTHGERFLEFLDEEQRKRFGAGELVVIDRDEEGANHYGSFQAVDFVRNNLLTGFELVKHFPGKGELRQDIYIVRSMN